MAKRIFTLVTRLRELSSQQGGYSSTPELVTALSLASMQMWNAMLPAKSPRAMGPGLNRSFDSRLHPFLRAETFTATDMQADDTGVGSFTLSAPGYVSAYDADGADSVEEVQAMAWNQRRRDCNSGPTTRAPIVRDGAGSLKHDITPVPANLTAWVYSQPTEPVYAVDYVSDLPVYNDTNSVDMGWGPEADPEILVRAMRLLGLEIRDPQLAATAAQLTAETL